MSQAFIVTYLRSGGDGWPIDIGDDPAFEASATYRGQGGVLSWGVCRQDVRNALQEGDLVLFFAADRLADRKPARYWFVAFARVSRKITAADIWEDPSYSVYQHYQNLLIRPCERGYEHFEPNGGWHADWFWRICDKRGLRKSDVRAIEEQQFVSSNEASLRFTTNYVLFEPEGPDTCVLRDPPIVAEVFRNGEVEVWQQDSFAQQLRSDVSGLGSQRGLRTTNKQQAHRHIIVRDTDTDVWLERLHHLCSVHGLGPRFKPGEPEHRSCD